MSPNDALSPKQRAAIAALLGAKSITAAAADLRISRKTLQRWLADPQFAAALAEAESDLLHETTRLLLAFAGMAVFALVRNLTAEDAPASVRNAAACAILDRLVTLREHAQLSDRVAEMEAWICRQSGNDSQP